LATQKGAKSSMGAREVLRRTDFPARKLRRERSGGMGQWKKKSRCGGAGIRKAAGKGDGGKRQNREEIDADRLGKKGVE